MKRSIAGVCAGLFAWFVIATAINLLLRISWPDYAGAEKPMTFTLDMMLARLALSALSSLCAGYVAAWVARQAGMPIYVLAGILLLMFIPTHYSLWSKFPEWYHITFLASLPVLVIFGSKLRQRAAD